MYRRAYIEVNLTNIEENIKSILATYTGYDYYIGVVKGDAYGHTMYSVQTLVASGINYLAVSNLDEAIEVRKIDRKIPILCLQPIELDYIKEIITNDITITVSSYDYFQALKKIVLPTKVKIHLKIDSGMSRLGFQDKYEVKEVVDDLKEQDRLILEGIYTHIATLGVSDPYWDQQLKDYQEITSLIKWTEIPIRHIASSSSLFNHPKIERTNGVRIGICMYGYSPFYRAPQGIKGKLHTIKRNYLIKKYQLSKTLDESNVVLKPAFSFFTEIIEIKEIKKGFHVGYGLNYIAKKDLLIGIIPVGYADGFVRKNEGRLVSIKGKKYPLIGQISMGMATLAIDSKVKVGDVVTLIGQEIGIRQIAQHTNTTIYETMSLINKRIPRVFIKDDKMIHIES